MLHIPRYQQSDVEKGKRGICNRVVRIVKKGGNIDGRVQVRKEYGVKGDPNISVYIKLGREPREGI